MAIVGTQVASTLNNRNAKVWDITKAADADAGPNNVAHGFGVVPFAWLNRTITIALSDELALTTIDATNIAISAQGVVGSAGGVPGATVVAQLIAVRPSSLVK